MRDTETALELRDVDIPEVLDEVGSTLILIKESTEASFSPTGDDTQTTSYETNGVIYKSNDYYGNVMSAAGARNAVMDISKLPVLPMIADSVQDEDGTVYKITDVEIVRFAGIPVTALLEVEM